MLKEYESIVLNGYTTKPFLDKALKELTDKGFQISCTIMGNMLIMEREVQKEQPKTLKMVVNDSTILETL
jgi:hypothetical protein